MPYVSTSQFIREARANAGESSVWIRTGDPYGTSTSVAFDIEDIPLLEDALGKLRELRDNPMQTINLAQEGTHEKQDD